MDEKPNCTNHGDICHNQAVAKVKRIYDCGQYHAFFVCGQCLREVRHMASKYMFTIEVEQFNRRSTDKLRRAAA